MNELSDLLDLFYQGWRITHISELRGRRAWVMRLHGQRDAELHVLIPPTWRVPGP